VRLRPYDSLVAFLHPVHLGALLADQFLRPTRGRNDDGFSVVAWWVVRPRA